MHKLTPRGLRSFCSVGRLSENPSLLPNTTVLYSGRILNTGVTAIESSYVDYIDRKILAGFVTSSDPESYARIAMDHQMICFNVYVNAIAGQARIPGLFTMLGGPAFGPNALVKIIRHYRWSKVVLYFQNAPEDVISSEAFASIALKEGIDLDLQKRESAGEGAAEADLKALQAAKSNIFIFFGGSMVRRLERW